MNVFMCLWENDRWRPKTIVGVTNLKPVDVIEFTCFKYVLFVVFKVDFTRSPRPCLPKPDGYFLSSLVNVLQET